MVPRLEAQSEKADRGDEEQGRADDDVDTVEADGKEEERREGAVGVGEGRGEELPHLKAEEDRAIGDGGADEHRGFRAAGRGGTCCARRQRRRPTPRG